MAGMLRHEATLIGSRLNPFDPSLRRAGAAMAAAEGGHGAGR
jgi:hypothetical protein